MLKSIALVFLASAPLASADIALDFELEVDGEKHQIRMSIAGDRLRFDAAQGSTIIAPSENRTMMLFHGTRTFVSFKQDALLSGLGELPQSGEDAQAAVKRTGERQRIGAFDCEKVIFEDSDRGSEELWLSREAPPMALAAGPGGRSMDKLGVGFAQTWKKWLSGHPDLVNVPVRSITRDASGKELLRTTLTGFSTNALSSEIFTPPPGYSEQEMPLFDAPPKANADELDAKMLKLDGTIRRLEQELKKLEQDMP